MQEGKVSCYIRSTLVFKYPKVKASSADIDWLKTSSRLDLFLEIDRDDRKKFYKIVHLTNDDREDSNIVNRDDFCRRSLRRVTNHAVRTHILYRVASRLHRSSLIQGLADAKVHDNLEVPHANVGAEMPRIATHPHPHFDIVRISSTLLVANFIVIIVN